MRAEIRAVPFDLVVIDEAHKLSPEVLEEIRLLGNFESAADKFLQILLLGQSELDDLLNRHDLRQFKQRIALRLYIDRLSPAEVQQELSKVAQGQDALLLVWSNGGNTFRVLHYPEGA